MASTDPPVAKAFRAPRRTIWTRSQELINQGPPSSRIDAQTRPWFTCVAEWMVWLGQVALPVLWVFALFILAGLLLTLDCGKAGSSRWMNCREGFALNFAIWGTIFVVAVSAVVFVCKQRCQTTPSSAAVSSRTSDVYGKMVVSSP